MRDKTTNAEAVQKYSAAYFAHYTVGDVCDALELYRGIVDTYPSTLEAELSQMQINKIVKYRVPSQELRDARVKLIPAHLEYEGSSDAETAPVKPCKSSQI